jgi:predicted RNA-binding protein YlqC (UPF0109 family)
MDENDIIIALSEYIKKQEKEFTLNFETVEVDLFIPQGSLEAHLETAAEEAGYEIVRKGATVASLRKSPPRQIRIERG